MTNHSTEIRVCKSAEALAHYALGWLSQAIREHQALEERPFVLALSGGSTPKRLYQLMADLPSGLIDWRRVVLVWGDERNVPADHEASNFRMVQENLLAHIDVPEENVLAVPNPGEAANAAASQYEVILRERISDSEGKPTIDCALLGMGDDVHTASLFPGTQALQEEESWVRENWVEKLDCWRITLTAPLINSARRVAFLIAGKNKQQALHLLWHGERDPSLYPAQLIQPPEGELFFFLDESALGENRPPESSMFDFVS